MSKKFILEEFEDIETIQTEQPELDITFSTEMTDQEIDTFHSSIITDLLNEELNLFNHIQGILTDPEDKLDETTKVVLNSVSEDVSVSIGKLQQCLKDVVDEKTQDLISDGEEQTQELTNM